MVNPIAKIVLVVNACERLHQRFAAHAISAEKHHLPVHGSCYRTSESFLQNVNHRLLIFIRGRGKQHAQLTQDVVLPIFLVSARFGYASASAASATNSSRR